MNEWSRSIGGKQGRREIGRRIKARKRYERDGRKKEEHKVSIESGFGSGFGSGSTKSVALPKED